MRTFLLTLLLLAALLSAFGQGSVSPSPERNSPARRIARREFPSVFQAWSPADNLPNEDPWQTVARHDLVFESPGFFGLRWNHKTEGLGTTFTPESIVAAQARRRQLLARNPNLLMLAEIRYRDASRTYLSADSPWWKRDAEGKFVVGWEEGGYLLLDLANPSYQDQVATQAKAVIESGVCDGVMLDWWIDDADRLALVKKVRAAIGKDALILVNANDHTTPQTAAYVNGYFMECYRSKTAEDWTCLENTLTWAESHLRQPRINCLETWYETSRADLNRMRATTALALTASDGYCLFSDPNPLPTPDHLHDWYPFWEKSLGRPRSRGTKAADGTRRREFANGTVLYNPLGNAPCTVTFPTERRSLATGKISRTHTILALDGDILLRLK